MNYENIELLPVPSTSQSNNTTVNTSLSTQNLQDDDDEDADDFTTRQLFSFAWQIAKGMVMNLISCPAVCLYSCDYCKAKKLENINEYSYWKSVQTFFLVIFLSESPRRE